LERQSREYQPSFKSKTYTKMRTDYINEKLKERKKKLKIRSESFYSPPLKQKNYIQENVKPIWKEI